MTSRRRSLRWAACLVATLATRATAQSAPATTEPRNGRRGRVAAEFVAPNSSQLTSLGLVFFRSTTSAWIVNGRLRARDQREQRSTDPPGTPTRYQFVDLQLNIGRRRYTPVGDRSALFRTVGLSGGYVNPPDERFSGAMNTAQVSIGAFWEIGALIHPHPRLSLGAATRASVSVLAGIARGGSERAATRGVSASLEGLSVVVGLYF